MAPIRCRFDQTAVWHSDAARGPSTPSCDHVGGAAEQGWRHVEAESLGRDQVDDQLEFGRCLHRQVAWLLALEDTIHIAGRALVLVDLIRPVGGEATV